MPWNAASQNTAGSRVYKILEEDVRKTLGGDALQHNTVKHDWVILTGGNLSLLRLSDVRGLPNYILTDSSDPAPAP